MYNPKHDKVKRDVVFYGNYRGEVIDVEDPMEAGRIRVRVFSVYDDFAKEDIPWAIMADPFMGGQAALGGFFVPDKGSHVWVFFETGDPEQPVYFAGAPAKPHFPPEKDIDYPFNRVYKTKAGHLIEINEKSEYIHIQHNSGTEITMHQNGDITTNAQDVIVNCVNSTVNASESVNANTPVVNISNDVNVGGTVTVNGDVVASGVSLVNHIHTGVKSGSDTSGPPA